MTQPPMGTQAMVPTTDQLFAGEGEVRGLLRKLDWQRSPLGPPDAWDPGLRMAVQGLLACPEPMYFAWGNDEVLFYNEAYLPQMGERHPWALGRPAREVGSGLGQGTHDPEQLKEIERLNRHLAMHRSELETLLDVIPVGIGIAEDRECRSIRVNKAFASALGIRPDENASQTAPEEERPLNFYCRDESGERIPGDKLPMQVAAREGRVVSEAELDVVHADGRVVRLLEYAAPLLDDQGNPRGSVGAFIDITSRRREEVRQEFLLRLGDAVRPLVDPKEIMSTYSRLLGEHLDVDRCAYADVDEDQETFNLLGDYTRGVKSIVGRYTFSQFGEEVLRLMRKNKPFIVNDVAQHEPSLRNLEAYEATEIGAAICVPLHKGGRFAAAMAVHQKMPRVWQPDEIELVGLIAARCWESIERTRIARHLEESEGLYRTLIDTISSIVWTTNPDGEMISCPSWGAFTGQSPEEYRGWGWLEAIHPDDQLSTQSIWRAALATLQPYEAEYRLLRHDGEYRQLVARGAPVFGLDGVLSGWIGNCTDVTESRNAETELREARERLEVALIAGEVATWVWLIPEDRVVADRNLSRLYGISEEEAARGNIAYYAQAVHPDDRQDLDLLFRQIIKQGDSFETEYRVMQADGSHRVVIARGRVERNDDGWATRMSGVVLDVTDRKRMEEALLESESRFRTVADNISQFAWTADSEGSQFWFNKRWHDYTGTTPEEVSGWGWQAVLHPDYVDAVTEKYRHCIRTGTVWEDTFPLRGKDGEYRWFLSRAVPIHNQQESVIRWFGTNTDVTELKQANEALREADRRKDEFLAILAHELRNPLAPISNAVELLGMEGIDAEAQQEVRKIMKEQVQQMVRLIDDLLDVSRISRGKIQLRKERLDLRALAQSAAEAVRSMCVEAGHQFDLQMDNRPIPVEADATRISQVISNLLTNACKYTPPGGHISLTALCDGSEAVVQVSDDGHGIPVEKQRDIFEMFSQLDTSLERGQAGLGLGLTLVKSLVEMHEGTVAVDSPGQGQGSTFVVRLPLAAAAEEREKLAAPAAEHALNRRKVMVVEDSKAVADMFTLMLRTLGHEVCLAPDGPTALEKFGAFRPEIVFSDISMPRMTGYELVRLLRTRPDAADVYFVAMTGYAQTEDRAKALAAGFHHHLVKPAELEDLKGLLDSVAKGKTTYL